MDPAQIEQGATYRTTVATWTVETICTSGMVYVRRDDGRRASFGLRSFAGWVVERIA